MGIFESILLVVHVLVAIGICVLVLLQHGKGADMGAAFGGGASGSLFGATGSANFLSRSTAVAATVFFVATLGLAWTGSAVKRPASGGGGVMESIPAPALPRDIPVPANTAPAAGTPPATPAAPAATPATPAAPKPGDVPK
jgi:preprotein translocase subunit SecG